MQLGVCVVLRGAFPARLWIARRTPSGCFDWTGAFLQRSILCCVSREHFGAMYSQQHSHRDRPMTSVAFLQAIMQTSEHRTDPAEW